MEPSPIDRPEVDSVSERPLALGVGGLADVSNTFQTRIVWCAGKVELNQGHARLRDGRAQHSGSDGFSAHAPAGLTGRVGRKPSHFTGSLDDRDKRIGCRQQRRAAWPGS